VKKLNKEEKVRVVAELKKLNKEEKVRVVAELQDKFDKAKGVVFTDYRGLNVEEISGLRNSLRSSAIEYKVVKNTLAKRAAEGTQLDSARDIISGPIGIAVGYDDPVLVVKKVLEFNKSNEKLEIKGGVIEGNTCTPAGFEDYFRTAAKRNPAFHAYWCNAVTGE
jgi:large subunit ribosomal protein L10